MKRLIVGWYNGIGGPSALSSSAAEAFNSANKDGIRHLEVYPVTYEGTSEAAFYVEGIGSWNPKDSDYDKMKASLKERATEFVDVINGIRIPERLHTKRLVAGTNPNNTTEFDFASSAAAAFNRLHKRGQCPTGLQIEFYSVTFEDTYEPAFHLSYCWRESEITLEEVKEILTGKAALLVEVYNRNLASLEVPANVTETTSTDA